MFGPEPVSNIKATGGVDAKVYLNGRHATMLVEIYSYGTYF